MTRYKVITTDFLNLLVIKYSPFGEDKERGIPADERRRASEFAHFTKSSVQPSTNG